MCKYSVVVQTSDFMPCSIRQFNSQQIRTEAVRKIVSELPKEKSLDEVLAAAVKVQAEHKEEDIEEDASSSSSEDKSETDSGEEWSVDNDEAYRPVHAYDCPCQYCSK